MRIEDLEEVNDLVNRLPYVSDAARYHQPEFWARIDADGGDCEDYALGKLNQLLERGWPPAVLRLACCWCEVPGPDNYHAVLAVDMPDGSQAVLDNRWFHVCSLEELQRTGYVPDRIQLTGGSRHWVRWIWQSA